MNSSRVTLNVSVISLPWLCWSVTVRMAEGFLMETCVDSVESAVNAERGGRFCEHYSAPSFEVLHGITTFRLVLDL